MRICIVKLSALGDIVHTLACLSFIKTFLPQSRVDFVTESCFSSLLKEHPCIDNLYTVELKKAKSSIKLLKNEIKNAKELSKNGYDIVIDLQGLIKSALCARLISKNVVGFDKNSIREAFASYFYAKSYYIDYRENIILRNLKLTAKALELEDKLEEFNIQQPHLFSTKQTQQRDIIFAIGSSWKCKVYPKERYIKLAKMFNEKIFITYGNDEELQEAICIKKECENVEILPKVTLFELKDIIKNAKLLIGSDSGITHMAWALRTPSIVIYGATPYFRNTLEDELTKTIFAKKEIDPLKLDKSDFCIATIDEKEIYQKALELL